MEIKTLEHYAIMKLEEKDRRIEELEREQDKLMAKLDELTNEYQHLRQQVSEFGARCEINYYNDEIDRKYISFPVVNSINWNNETEPEFDMLVKLFGIKEDEYES